MFKAGLRLGFQGEFLLCFAAGAPEDKTYSAHHKVGREEEVEDAFIDPIAGRVAVFGGFIGDLLTHGAL